MNWNSLSRHHRIRHERRGCYPHLPLSPPDLARLCLVTRKCSNIVLLPARLSLSNHPWPFHHLVSLSVRHFNGQCSCSLSPAYKRYVVSGVLISKLCFLCDFKSADLTVVHFDKSIIPCGDSYGVLAKNNLEPFKMKYLLRQSCSSK